MQTVSSDPNNIIEFKNLTTEYKKISHEIERYGKSFPDYISKIDLKILEKNEVKSLINEYFKTNFLKEKSPEVISKLSL